MVYLEKPNTAIEFKSGESAKHKTRFTAAEMQGWRINMEDAQISDLEFKEQKALFAVFDGHGGREVARYSEKYYPGLLVKEEGFAKGDYKDALRRSFLKVDESLKDGGLTEVAEMKKANPPAKSPIMKILSESIQNKDNSEENKGDDDLQLDSIGCTANVVMMDYAQKKIFVANAGDSRCVMGAGGRCTALSFDHKPEGEVEIARITKCGSQIIDGRVDGNLNLTRALGDLKHKQKLNFTPEEQPITANPDCFEYDMPADLDFVFMGCDGVWERKTNEEMVAWIYERLNNNKEKADLKEICADLLKNECLSPDHAQTGGLGCDNMTCILIVFAQ